MANKFLIQSANQKPQEYHLAYTNQPPSLYLQQFDLNFENIQQYLFISHNIFPCFTFA